MNARAIRWLTIGFLALLLAGAVTPGLGAQHDLGQRPGMTTSDDPRRVPVPSRDISKDPILVLKGGTLIDGTDSQPIADAVVVIQGDRILEAGPAGKVTAPVGADRVIDTAGLYIVPGLIDLHVHMRNQRGEDFTRYRDSESAIAIRGIEQAARLLDGGITAVRDLGGVGDTVVRIKEAIERGMFPGPRLFWSGRIIATRGGHGDEITETASGRPKSLETSPGVRVATGPWDWRLAVREQVRLGADVIKMTAPATREEMAAGIDEAHMHGIRVAIDAFGEFITWAVEAGVDTLEHPLAVPDKALTLMAQKGTAFVPTMTAFYNPLTVGYPSAGIPPGGFFFTMSRRFYMTHETNMETLRKARAAGVKMGIGTDIPFEMEKRYPGDYFTELRFFKEAGYTDKDILAFATRTGAEILDMADKLGTIQKGKLADIVVVGANPLADIQNLRQMKLVIADGRVVRNNLGTSQQTTSSERR